jgi:hypothetical protein
MQLEELGKLIKISQLTLSRIKVVGFNNNCILRDDLIN